MAKPRAEAAARPVAPRRLELLTIQEVADYAKVSAQTVRRWISPGNLKIYRAGRQIRVDMNDLVEFLSQS